MCTKPIEIHRSYPDGSTRIDVVPCGKCAECRSKKQGEFAALALLESLTCKSMYFVTLTYRNENVPIVKVVQYVRGGELVDVSFSGFVEPDTKLRKVLIRNMQTNMTIDGPQPLKQVSVIRKSATPYESDTEFDAVIYTPSLRREDFRLFVKRARVAYYREFGEKLQLRYACFGEYGSVTKRPHYHALFYDLTPSQVAFLESRWNEEFGFCRFDNIPMFNLDGSPARVKCAKYVSKYIAKGADDYPAVALNLVERPRRISSRKFGVKSISDKELQSLKSFINAPI